MADITDQILQGQNGASGAARSRGDITDKLLGGPVPQQGATNPAPQADDVSFGRAFGITSLNRFLDNLMGAPELLAQSFRRGPMEAASAAAGALTGGVQDPLAPTPQPMPGREIPGPLIGGRSDLTAPQGRILPSGQDVRAGFRAAGEMAQDVLGGQAPQPQAAFQQGLREEQATETRMAEEAPVGTTLGGIVGDAATIMSGRMPMARALRNSRLTAQRAPRAPRGRRPGPRQLLDDVLETKTIKSLSRGLGKSTEAGFEGATLSLLSDGDPLETAAFAAGGQAAGSLALAVSGIPDFFGKNMIKGSLKLAATAAALTTMARLGQEFGPGENNIFDAGDVAFQKMQYALLLGTGAALSGAGRVRGSLADNLPIVADAITTIPRGAVLSVINDLTRDRERGDQTPARVLEMMSENPAAFTPDARRKLERAMRDSRVSFSKTVDELMRNRNFQRTFDDLNRQPASPDATGAPPQ